jgi:site-specific recombinase XerD
MRLQTAIEQYLALKQSLGFRYRSESKILRAFSRAMGGIGVGQVKPKSVRAFLDGNGPVTRNWICKWTALRGFYHFALDRKLTTQSPLPERPPKVVQSFTPYIYSQQELQRILQAITPERTGCISVDTMRTIVLLLYGAGLRLSEALNLKIEEVDLKERLLNVYRSKFFKSRLVPIGPKLAQVLADYQRGEYPAVGATSHHFFRTPKGSPVRSHTVQAIFRSLCLAAGVKRTDGARYQPRLHDLRHSSAVHRLEAWYREGVDLQVRLIQLSTYLGHMSLAGTQKYLTLTPAVYAHASARFARYALGGDHE